jgi:hypothetical protein
MSDVRVMKGIVEKWIDSGFMLKFAAKLSLFSDLDNSLIIHSFERQNF